VSEARQRWRLVFAREDDARYLSHLDAVKLWERAFRRGSIPVAVSEGFSPRPRLVFAAPLPLGMLAEHDLADLYLAERLVMADLRTRLADGMPRGYRLVELHDEWVGAPALATRLAAADYRMTVLGVSRESVVEAVGALMRAERLERTRRREAKTTVYDLRPLIMDVRVEEGLLSGGTSGTEAAGLWMRLRHTQDQGSGRAEEVVAALADEMGLAADGRFGPTAETGEEGEPREVGQAGAAGVAGRPALEIVQPVRERLWLADELPA
jgi:radical SAM-linked protein